MDAFYSLIASEADIILVSGGNTLFTIDRWQNLGLTKAFQTARDRGCVLCGGSAGAICWFDGGHSDSGDPDTWVAVGKESVDQAVGDEDSTATSKWEYVRISGLGMLPGI